MGDKVLCARSRALLAIDAEVFRLKREVLISSGPVCLACSTLAAAVRVRVYVVCALR